MGQSISGFKEGLRDDVAGEPDEAEAPSGVAASPGSAQIHS
jgi:hypothetical protein